MGTQFHSTGMTVLPVRARGFTRIEVLVVVILGILAAIVVPRVMSRPGEARVVKASQDIRAIGAAVGASVGLPVKFSRTCSVNSLTTRRFGARNIGSRSSCGLRVMDELNVSSCRARLEMPAAPRRCAKSWSA